jgi:SRSO17 transposase
VTPINLLGGLEDAILVVDETGFLKKGKRSAGVQRQYTGTAGRVENCQIGAFLGLALSGNHRLVDRELYIPEAWLNDSERSKRAGIPPDRTFQTKPMLAKAMIQRAIDGPTAFAWFTGDEIYGSDGRFRLFYRTITSHMSSPYVGTPASWSMGTTAESIISWARSRSKTGSE